MLANTVDFEQGTVTIQSGDDWHTKNYRSRTMEMTSVLCKTMLRQRKLYQELRVRLDYVFTYRGHRIKCIVDMVPDNSFEQRTPHFPVEVHQSHCFRRTIVVVIGYPNIGYPMYYSREFESSAFYSYMTKSNYLCNFGVFQ